MKKLILLLALNCFCLSANAQDSTSDKVKVNASMRFRTEVKNKTDFVNNLNFSLLKARIDVLFTPDSNTSFFIQPQGSKTMGDIAYVGSSTTANTATDTSGSTTDTNFTLHQGWMEYKASSDLSFKVGRQILSYGDELVVGPLEWNNTGRAFDGLKVKMFSEGNRFFDLFTAKIQETNASANSTGDKDFSGAYLSYPVEDMLQALDFYGFYSRNSTTATVSELYTYGVRVKKTMDAFDMRAEFTNQERESFGNQLNAEVGYAFEDSKLTKVSLEYFTASKNYNQLYPTAHKWLGYADIFGRRNISGLGLHLNFNVAEALTAQLDAFKFDRVETTTAAYKASGAALGSGVANTEKALGQEVDLTLKYKLSDASMLVAGYSYFSPGKYFDNQFPDVSPSFYYLQLEAKY